MRFSAVAVSAAIFGVAMAIPASVVYETEIVTITSCAPDKTDCPGRIHSSTTSIPVVYTPPAVPTSAPAVVPTSSPAVVPTSIYTPPVVIPTTSAIPVPSSSYISYPNGTVPISHTHTKPVVSVPVTSGTIKATASTPATTYAWVPSASAGIPSAPANTSTPVVPTTPPTFQGAASIKGFSFAAVAVAAAAFVLA